MNMLMSSVAIATLALTTSFAWCQYKPVTPRRQLAAGEVAVTKPGIYAGAGTTYVLMNDITSPRTALFLGKDVTLDLNGYTIRYADGAYQHVPNYSFEEGLDGWDVTHAPGARVEDQRWVHPIVGNNVCLLPEGQEIARQYVTLPEADRAYFAMALVASDKMRIRIRVQNERGEDVQVAYRVGGENRDGVPITANTRLGGGGVIGLFSGQPAGKYRILVKAVEGDAVLDCIDIRPAMDVGVGVIGTIRPYAYHKGLYDGELPMFYDYSTAPLQLSSKPRSDLPVVSGGTVTIRNGTIRSGFRGVQSTGILCSSNDTTLVIENVKFEAAGINANGLRTTGDVQMRHCRFEIDTPFIINRHVHDMAAVITGKRPSEVAYCEFIGGQGNLAISGDHSEIHHNLFVNAQTVTNHYSLGADASGLKIHNNRFEPRTGSGIYIYRNRDCEVYDNTFDITSAPPNNEYSRTDYSTSAIRISDYNESAGSPKACVNNRIYRNKIRVTGMPYPQASKGYMSMAYGVFMSVGGGQNYVYENEITVDNRHPTPDTGEAYAFYVGGSNNGGVYHDNIVTSNTSFIWIGTRYGVGSNVQVYNNTFNKAAGSKPFKAIRLGWYRYPAANVGFYSNQMNGLPFDVEILDNKRESAFEMGWTLAIHAQPGTAITVLNQQGDTAAAGATDTDGIFIARLPQVKVSGTQTITTDTYTVKSPSREARIKLTADQIIDWR